MPASFNLRLDTTPPKWQKVEFSLTKTSELIALLELQLEAEESYAGYQLKVWGDVDPTFDPNVQLLEGESEWFDWSAEEFRVLELALAEGDGNKTVHVLIRDDVWNQATVQEASIELVTTVPTITITAGPTPDKISKVTGKDVSVLTFKSDEDLQAWKIEVVSGEEASEGTGSPLTNADSHGEEVEGEKNETAKVHGDDFQAHAGADGEYVLKVFGQSKASGLWSL